jgi:hypothetical protein
MERTCNGKLFQARGSATLNDLSPSNVRVLRTSTDSASADRSTDLRPMDIVVRTRSVRYDSALPCRQRNTSVQTISLGQSDVSHPVGQLAARQRKWDKPHIDADLAKLMASVPDGHHHVRLLEVAAPRSGEYMRCPFHLAVFVQTTRPSE